MWPIISAMTYRLVHMWDGLPICISRPASGLWCGDWISIEVPLAIRCALDALHRGSHARMQSLAQAEGHHICLELLRRMDAKYIDVRRSLQASAYQITPDDIRVGTEGRWRHALLLENLSGLAVLNTDSREGKSPMVNWCAEHAWYCHPTSVLTSGRLYHSK